MASTAIDYTNKAWEIMRDLHLNGSHEKGDFTFNVTIGANIKGDSYNETAQVFVNFNGEMWHEIEWENNTITVTQWWGQHDPVATETINF